MDDAKLRIISYGMVGLFIAGYFLIYRLRKNNILKKNQKSKKIQARFITVKEDYFIHLLPSLIGSIFLAGGAILITFLFYMEFISRYYKLSTDNMKLILGTVAAVVFIFVLIKKHKYVMIRINLAKESEGDEVKFKDNGFYIATVMLSFYAKGNNDLNVFGSEQKLIKQMILAKKPYLFISWKRLRSIEKQSSRDGIIKYYKFLLNKPIATVHIRSETYSFIKERLEEELSKHTDIKVID